MNRRGRNEGTIRRRADGRWEARAVVTASDGRRVRRSFLGRTRAVVTEKLHEALGLEARGSVQPSSRLTVGVFLEQWLEVVRPRIRPLTFDCYRGIVRRHLEPGLGQLVLARLSPRQVQLFLNGRSAAGSSPRTVAMIRAVLRQALGQAERWDLVTRNAAKLTQAPRVPRHEIRPLTPAEAGRFIEAISGDQLEALYPTALAVGLRQGELLGLTWSDLDLAGATVTIRQALQRIDGLRVSARAKTCTTPGSWGQHRSLRSVCVPAATPTGPRRTGRCADGGWIAGRRGPRLRAMRNWSQGHLSQAGARQS